MSSPQPAATPTSTDPHTCNAAGCGIAIPPDEFMCEPHLLMVPKPIRQAVQATYQPGQDTTANPYLTAALTEVAHKQARSTKVRPRQKPVQLALFDLDKK